MEEQRNSKKNDLIPAASTKMNSCLSDRDRSSIKSASGREVRSRMDRRSKEESLLAHSCGTATDCSNRTRRVRPSLSPTFRVGQPPSVRTSTGPSQRNRGPSWLTDLSGIEVRPGTLRLLSKTDYKLFEEDDWRALLSVCMDPIWRRELHRLERISRILVHQIRQVPGPIFCRAILAVLNVLAVSTEHWGQFSRSLEEGSTSTRPALIRKARRVRSVGSFWDYFFECIECSWKPFVFPQSFSASPLLKLLETSEQMRGEGLRMKNCVGQRVPRVVAGWDAYFHWQRYATCDSAKWFGEKTVGASDRSAHRAIRWSTL